MSLNSLGPRHRTTRRDVSSVFRWLEWVGFESMWELVLQLVIEIIGQVVFELLVALGLESLSDSGIRERESRPLAGAIAQFLIGLCAGGLSLLMYSRRVSPHSAIPGLSLVLSPLGTGIAMHWLGEMWRDRGKEPPPLFSFKAGALFAFGMALARFVYLEPGWRFF